jgi:predicted phage gp36 major capsid-like protein
MYFYLAVGLVILALSGAIAVEQHRVETLKQDLTAERNEFASFRDKVKAEGELAKAEATKQLTEGINRKQEADNENARLRSSLNDTTKRMRDAIAAASASRSTVPPAPAASARPDLACFDRAGLDAALAGYRQDLLGIIAEGASAVLDLDTAKKWAQSVK